MLEKKRLVLDISVLINGETSVIAYTVTQSQCAVVIDEKKARRICKEVLGTDLIQQCPSLKIRGAR